MKIVSFSQGSEEWVRWRKFGIGASDVPIIMGSNPYKTPRMLWDIKCGFKEEDPLNSAMKHGIANEDRARQWMNTRHQLNLKSICIEDSDKTEFKASLDGFDFDSQTLVEIKCPISENVLDAARLSHSVPQYWYDQIQWQIMLCNPKRAILAMWDYRNNGCITIEMMGIKERILEMREEASKFWQAVKMGKPPIAKKQDYIEIDDDELHEAIEEYKLILSQEKPLSARKKELKSKIDSYGEGNSFSSKGVKVRWVDSSPRYDLDQMKIDGIDIEKYKKLSTSAGFYKIFFPKT